MVWLHRVTLLSHKNIVLGLRDFQHNSLLLLVKKHIDHIKIFNIHSNSFQDGESYYLKNL